MSVISGITNQIKVLLGKIQEKHPLERVVAVQTDNGTSSVNQIVVNERIYKVCYCHSDLQIRESLSKAADSDASLLIITDFATEDLEQDLLARLARRKVFSLQPWEILLGSFQARAAAPSLRKQKWIARFLLDDVPANGYPLAASGILDEETVWKIILVDHFGMSAARPDLKDLLFWTLETEKLKIFGDYPEEVQNGIRDWIWRTAGETSRTFFSAVKNGEGEKLIALGLACEIISEHRQTPEINRSAVRIERYFDNQPLPSDASRELASAAAAVINHLRAVQPNALKKIFAQADEILKEILIEDYAYLSSTLPAGFTARLKKYGQELISLTASKKIKNSPSLYRAASEIFAHRLLKTETERREKIEMSLRLANWLAAEPTKDFDDFTDTANFYAAEISYVDWARKIILHGDADEIFAEGLTRLQKLVTAKRERQNENFGRLFADWTKNGSFSENVWRIEEIMGDVVARLAARNRVLVLVLDGMSYAAFHEIQEDLTNQGWNFFAPRNDEIKPVIAALPSITNVSRASLFSGALTSGGSSVEAKNFASNRSLKAVSKSGFPPKLFHKASISNNIGASLTQELKDALQSENQSVVGAVINSIDDHLAKGEQIAVSWSLKTIPLLGKLLDAANETDRVVVLLSDHGHIIEQDAVYRKENLAGERYRTDNDAPKVGELLVSGNRVTALHNHKITAPWSETIRYAKKKHGYHGGISPQECVIPLAIISRAEEFSKDWHKTDKRAAPFWHLAEFDTPFDNLITKFVEKNSKSESETEKFPLFEQI